MQADSKDSDTTPALKFFHWAYENGTKTAEDLHYVMLPESVIKLVEKTWQDSVKVNGKPAWPAK
jgi:phosphate transport system substrate-binding protein